MRSLGRRAASSATIQASNVSPRIESSLPTFQRAQAMLEIPSLDVQRGAPLVAPEPDGTWVDTRKSTECDVAGAVEKQAEFNLAWTGTRARLKPGWVGRRLP